MTGREIVAAYLHEGYRIVTWPAIGDSKGPREEGWTTRAYSLDDYVEGYRVGIMTGTEVSPGRFPCDVDLDWQPGALIAQNLLPLTEFVYGRASKRISHCFYTTDQPVVSFRFEDIDKICLIEMRGTKTNGDIGMQTMVPPSVWSKDGVKEPLKFVKAGIMAHLELVMLKRSVTYAAIGMILAKHLGTNGFGHEVRLMWAGYLLRAGIEPEDLIKMGEAMSAYCNNSEVSDVRRAVESTVSRLKDPKLKIKGGPALAKHIGTSGRKIIQRISEWLGKEEDFVRNDKGVIVAKHQGNIRKAVEMCGDELTYNEFSDKLLFNGHSLEDSQTTQLYLRIDREFHFQPPIDYFRMVIADIAWSNSFHPVKQYLDGLTWDGVPRIDRWLVDAARAEDTDYIRAISCIFLIAAVRRIRQPGCKYDEMMVWESGTQGTEKSSAAQALCPDPKWFSDDLRLNLHSQQLIEATLGKWIVEASDLAGKRKTEIEQLKAMLSRQVDGPARMAYTHFPVERPRHFIIVGTTNSRAYLTDPTGARRFWPMTVRAFNVQWIKTHRDQLWAEACVREAQGESIRLPEDLWPMAAEQQEKRREIDPWEQIIRSYLLGLDVALDGNRRTATSEIWEALGIQIHQRDRYGALRISDIMQRLGFKRGTVRRGRDVATGYVTEDATRLEVDEDIGVIEPLKDETQF